MSRDIGMGWTRDLQVRSISRSRGPRELAPAVGTETPGPDESFDSGHWRFLAAPTLAAKAMTAHPVQGVDLQDCSVEQLPVTLGDDSNLAVDDGDGGLVVDGVAGHIKRGGPALRVR